VADALEETASHIDGAVIVPTDVSDKVAVDDLARAAVKASGRVDVWANVAGIIRNASIVDTTEDDLEAVLAVNLEGVCWGTAAAQVRTAVLGSRASASPLGVVGEPRDIAWAMLYLATDASKFMTGQVVRPNGGVHMA